MVHMQADTPAGNRGRASAGDQEIWVFGDFILDLRARTLCRGARVQHLPPRECKLLCVLLRARGMVIGRDRLIELIWPDQDVGDAALTKAVQKLRDQLGPGGEQAIRTVYKYGYQLTLPVHAAKPPDTADDARWLVPIGEILAQLAGRFEDLPLCALRSALAIAVICLRAGQLEAASSVFSAVHRRLCVSHGEQFALTQLAAFYWADCLVQLGGMTADAAELLAGLRVEALAHVEPDGRWNQRLQALRLRCKETAGPALRFNPRPCSA